MSNRLNGISVCCWCWCWCCGSIPIVMDYHLMSPPVIQVKRTNAPTPFGVGGGAMNAKYVGQQSLKWSAYIVQWMGTVTMDWKSTIAYSTMGCMQQWQCQHGKVPHNWKSRSNLHVVRTREVVGTRRVSGDEGPYREPWESLVFIQLLYHQHQNDPCF